MAGPFVGVSDTVPLSAQDANRCASLTNGMIRLPEFGDDVTARPGFTRRTVSGVTGQPAYLATAAPIRALFPYQHTDGVYYNLALVKATIDGGAFATGETLLSVNPYMFVRWNPVTPGYSYAMGIPAYVAHTFDAEQSRLWSKPFAGHLVISDGVNRPLKWSPANIGLASPTVSQLTDMPDVTYGRPATYYGKVFFIKGPDRTDIVWSEENDPNTGYEAVGFNNAWTLSQTSSDVLSAIVGTNDSLYVFRENSVTAIFGAANTDFRSSGTLEAIDNSIGTKSPGSVTLVNNQVWFLDQHCRPFKVEPGRGIIPLWGRCRETIKNADRSNAALYQAWGEYLPELDVVVFGYRATTGAAGNAQILVFSARTEEFLGTWVIANNSDMKYGVIFRDDASQAVLAVSEYGASSLTFHTQKLDRATDAATDALASTTAVPFTLETPRIFGDPEIGKLFGRVSVTTQRIDSAQPALKLEVRGSRDSAYSTPVTMNQTARTSDGPCRATTGIDTRNSRWLQARIKNDTANTARTTIGQVALYGDPTTVDWEQP